MSVCFALKEVSQLNIIETADGKMQTLWKGRLSWAAGYCLHGRAVQGKKGGGREGQKSQKLRCTFLAEQLG